VKALSIHQPWASLIALGKKKYETRSWSTSHRGPLLIHASKAVPSDYYKLLTYEPFRSALPQHSGSWPRGALIAVAQIADVVPVEELPKWAPDDREAKFGDFRPGRYAWLLTDIVPLIPIPYRGERALFDVAEAVLDSQYSPLELVNR
jgi:hypothetical protein